MSVEGQCSGNVCVAESFLNYCCIDTLFNQCSGVAVPKIVQTNDFQIVLLFEAPPLLRQRIRSSHPS